MIRHAVDKKKITIKQIQKLTGTLNFLSRAMVPGRAFMRRMYARLVQILDKKDKDGKPIKRVLKQYHHVNLDAEFILDCKMWELFLSEPSVTMLCRPFLDIEGIETANIIGLYSDASACETKGFGAYFTGMWIFGTWEPDYIRTCNPSIEYLELFALCAGVFTWSHLLQNRRIVIFCDNLSVVSMVNQTSSSCKNCMILIRLLVLRCLQYNMKIYVKHVFGYKNLLADALSRGKFKTFWTYAPSYTKSCADMLPKELWPASKLWKKDLL